MPTHDFKDIGDVLGFDILRGTITAIDTTTDTCTVTVDGASLTALLFYHCAPDSILRDNGSISGAASGFAVNDIVIVLKKHDGSMVKVIGHIDGIRRCELYVQIKFSAVTINYDFINLGLDRVSDIQRQRDYTWELKYNLIPDILDYYDLFLGKIYAWIGPLPVKYTAADIERYKKPWTDWRDNIAGEQHNQGYDSWCSQFDTMMGLWNMAVGMAEVLPIYLKGAYTGGLKPERDDSGHYLVAPVTIPITPSFVLNADCGMIDPQPTITDPDTSNPFQMRVDLSEASALLWEDPIKMSEDTSPICYGAIYITGSDIGQSGVPLRFSFYSRGTLDSDNVFYFFAKDCAFFFIIAGVVFPEKLEMSLTNDTGSEFFRFPSYNEYVVAHWDLVGNDVLNTHMDLSLSGRLSTLPTEFGGYVEAPVFSGLEIVSAGGPKATGPYTFFGDFLRTTTKIPTGFAAFAGAYYDHPIITGVDFGSPISPTGAAAISSLTTVNDYVNNKYTYVADTVEYWSFLSQLDTTGDCEDFALTKIQRLLDDGWSINDLQLACGIKLISYDPPVFDDDGIEIKKQIGHVWVLVNESIALNNGGALTTQAAMVALYPVDALTQRQLTWTEYPLGETYTEDPWPYTDFDMPLMTYTGTVQRM